MTRRGAAACIALICASFAWPQARAATPTASTRSETDRAAVTQLEQRWLAAVEPGGDRGALDAILADDYLDTDWQGRTRNKPDLMKAAAMQGMTQRVTGLRVRVWGDTAAATGINHVHMPSKNWSADVAFTDVFARVDGRWRAVASQETLQKPPH